MRSPGTGFPLPGRRRPVARSHTEGRADRPPRGRDCPARALAASPPAVVNATYGDTLTVFAEFDEPLRDLPVVHIAGVCGAVEMRPVTVGTGDGDGNSDAGAGTTSVPRTRFSASVTLRRPMCDVAKDGALNLTISGYTALSDGAPGPAVTPVTAVSGVARGSSVSFVDDD